MRGYFKVLSDGNTSTFFQFFFFLIYINILFCNLYQVHFFVLFFCLFLFAFLSLHSLFRLTAVFFETEQCSLISF